MKFLALSVLRFSFGSPKGVLSLAQGVSTAIGGGSPRCGMTRKISPKGAQSNPGVKLSAKFAKLKIRCIPMCREFRLYLGLNDFARLGQDQ